MLNSSCGVERWREDEAEGGQSMKEREKLPDESFAHVGGGATLYITAGLSVCVCV